MDVKIIDYQLNFYNLNVWGKHKEGICNGCIYCISEQLAINRRQEVLKNYHARLDKMLDKYEESKMSTPINYGKQDQESVMRLRRMGTSTLINYAVNTHVSMDSAELIQALCERIARLEGEVLAIRDYNSGAF